MGRFLARIHRPNSSLISATSQINSCLSPQSLRLAHAFARMVPATLSAIFPGVSGQRKGLDFTSISLPFPGTSSPAPRLSPPALGLPYPLPRTPHHPQAPAGRPRRKTHHREHRLFQSRVRVPVLCVASGWKSPRSLLIIGRYSRSMSRPRANSGRSVNSPGKARIPENQELVPRRRFRDLLSERGSCYGEVT
jgi:hypothetical protein